MRCLIVLSPVAIGDLPKLCCTAQKYWCSNMLQLVCRASPVQAAAAPFFYITPKIFKNLIDKYNSRNAPIESMAPIGEYLPAGMTDQQNQMGLAAADTVRGSVGSCCHNIDDDDELLAVSQATPR
jgi:hypothetical protein